MRYEFSLSMPRSGSWNGRWSSEGEKYLLYRNIDRTKYPNFHVGSFHHRWDDGWLACIDVRAMEKGERKKKSAGFCGYEWMVRNIMEKGSCYE